MYKRHRIIQLIIFASTLTLSLLLDPVRKAYLVYPELITIFSIIFGFTITSFSVLFTSDFVKELYNKSDKEKGSTQLHVLAGYYKHGFILSILTILVLLAVGVSCKDSAIETGFSYTLKAMVFPLVVINFYTFHLLLSIFIKIFVNNRN